MTRILTLARKLRAPSVIAGIILTLFLMAPTPVFAAPERSAASATRGKFQYHLIKQGSPIVIPRGAKQAPTYTSYSSTPYYTTLYCLNLWMNLSNPQLDVVEVYVQVQNYCGATVTNIHLSWDTGGKCNGVQYIGPSGGYTIASLSNEVGWGAISDWSTICWGDFYPPLPVSFTMAGYNDANGFISTGFRAAGSYDTETYTFK